MSALLLAVLGLGLAGLDPAGALLLGGALAAVVAAHLLWSLLAQAPLVE